MGLVHARALPREEFLLLVLLHEAVLHLLRLGGRALGLGELLVHDVALERADTHVMRIRRLLLYFNITAAVGYQHGASRAAPTDAATSALLARAWRRAITAQCLGNLVWLQLEGRRGRRLLRVLMLGREHLLLEVLAVTQLVLLDRKAEARVAVPSGVVCVTHGHAVGAVARGHERLATSAVMVLVVPLVLLPRV